MVKKRIEKFVNAALLKSEGNEEHDKEEEDNKEDKIITLNDSYVLIRAMIGSETLIVNYLALFWYSGLSITLLQ